MEELQHRPRTGHLLPKVMRKDYTVGLSPVGGGPDPDQHLYLNYGCGGELNYNGYCNSEVDKLIDQQSVEADPERRKKLVWEIERKLAEDGARPIIFYDRRATCWEPHVKGLTNHGQQHLQRFAYGRRLARQAGTAAERLSCRWTNFSTASLLSRRPQNTGPDRLNGTGGMAS
jgi:hypothetical protein